MGSLKKTFLYEWTWTWIKVDLISQGYAREPALCLMNESDACTRATERLPCKRGLMVVMILVPMDAPG